ncbi:MAG TPA: hypothetical protein VFL76_02895 [Edaphocola sp.]|nr:hypothetical protein [Edaphocola sp.]
MEVKIPRHSQRPGASSHTSYGNQEDIAAFSPEADNSLLAIVVELITGRYWRAFP